MEKTVKLQKMRTELRNSVNYFLSLSNEEVTFDVFSRDYIKDFVVEKEGHDNILNKLIDGIKYPRIFKKFYKKNFFKI